MSETRLAVLGSPIAHSKSPALHRAAYRALGLDWSYDAVEVPAGTLAGFVDAMDASWRGCSLTMPLKYELMPLLDETDATARATGAANTLRIADDGRRLGFNTDVGGIVAALRESGLAGVRSGVVIGAGATAGSAIAAFAELGAETVRVFARDPARAAETARIGRSLGLAVDVLPLAGLADAAGADATIGTLPGGVELGFAPSAALRASTLLDVAYDPWPSGLARHWIAAGSPVVDGLLMLLHQAVLQVRVFVAGDPAAPLPDEAAVVDAMRAALTAAAGR